jgi:LPXTG-motif cell wall-anchored protein
MKIKKSLESRIRGWFPKEFSLPRNQRTRMIDYLMRLRFFRAAYGVMLGALLFTPFGIYHSRVEPYIIGYLWGYHLPVGYVGLLLGIAVVLYPRLHAFRRLRFSALLPLIGLSLFIAFFFSPKDYFINLINGTNFSPAQIDVDFAVGNSAALGLSLLSIAFGLISFVQGWLPKEPHSPSSKRITNHKSPRIRLQIGIVAFVMGFAGGLLGAFGVSLGLFSGLSMYVWPILIGIVMAIVAGVILIRKKKNKNGKGLLER